MLEHDRWRSLLWLLGLHVSFAWAGAHVGLHRRGVPTQPPCHFQEDASQRIVVQGQAWMATQIIFPRRERVVDVIGGDALGWKVHVSPRLQNVVNIKPVDAKVVSNLHIVTLGEDLAPHYYHFLLRQVAETNKAQSRQHKLCHVLQFDAVTRAPTQSHPLPFLKKNQQYRFHGSRAIKPIEVFDDGHFTYFKWASDQTLPALFVVYDEAGHEQLLNYRRIQGYIVVMRIAPQFTLRYGTSQVASVFNERLIRLRGLATVGGQRDA